MFSYRNDKMRLIFLLFLQMPALVGAVGDGFYGHVIPEKTKMGNGIVVEHVHLYPQEAHDSLKRITRHGMLVRSDNAKATILICHGFMCDKYDVGLLRLIFKTKHFNIMTFDFRAHGQNSEGQYCTFGRDEALDVIAAAKFLRNHPDLCDKPLFCYGFSMGAVSAIEAQSQAPELFDAMILDCPFESSERVLETGLECLHCSIFGFEFDMPGKELLQKYAFHPYVQALVKAVLKTVAQMDATGINTNFCPVHPGESVKKITVPILFIHCKNDQKVTVDQVMNVYEGAAGHKKLLLTKGRHHYDSFFFNPEKYIENVRAFYHQYLNGELENLPQEGIVEDDEDDDHLFDG